MQIRSKHPAAKTASFEGAKQIAKAVVQSPVFWASVALPLAGHAAQHGVKLYDARQRAKAHVQGFNDMMALTPEISEMSPRAQMKARHMYNTLARINPIVAGDPSLSGAAILRGLQQENESTGGGVLGVAQLASGLQARSMQEGPSIDIKSVFDTAGRGIGESFKALDAQNQRDIAMADREADRADRKVQELSRMTAEARRDAQAASHREELEKKFKQQLDGLTNQNRTLQSQLEDQRLRYREQQNRHLDLIDKLKGRRP